MSHLQSSSHTIRWGIIGPGRIARSFANDIEYAPHASLHAVASRQLAGAQEFAEAFGVPRAYGSYAELFADPEVDAIYIATPHSHHKDQAIAALRAGKHVLCEKPATVTAADLEEVISVAKQERRYFMEAMWTYFFPVIQKAQEWVAAGRIGNLCHVKADFGFPLPYSPDLREYDNRLAGGCLLEMGIYPIAMAWLFLQQDPDTQTVWHHRAENGVEDDVVILNTYGKNTATAQLTTSFRSKLNNYLTLIGDRGTISIADYWCAREARLYQGIDSVDRFGETRVQQGFNYQIEQVSCELMAGKLQPEVVTWEDSRAFQRHMAEIKMRF
ncbi:MAG: Gfo/Idh/MocA family oxidoreductase [Porticoccaceae bacterium]|nr:Gfo/Idh/MocA family oxidoreductase [Porticoccaceae bacterium]